MGRGAGSAVNSEQILRNALSAVDRMDSCLHDSAKLVLCRFVRRNDEPMCHLYMMRVGLGDWWRGSNILSLRRLCVRMTHLQSPLCRFVRRN